MWWPGRFGDGVPGVPNRRPAVGVSGTVLGVLNASGGGRVGFGALLGEDGGHVGQQNGHGVVGQLRHA